MSPVNTLCTARFSTGFVCQPLRRSATMPRNGVVCIKNKFAAHSLSPPRATNGVHSNRTDW